MSKYRIPVSIHAYASYYIGDVECDSIEEFHEKADALWESKDWYSPNANISNDFDIDGEWEIDDLKDSDLKYYLTEEG